MVGKASKTPSLPALKIQMPLLLPTQIDAVLFPPICRGH